VKFFFIFLILFSCSKKDKTVDFKSESIKGFHLEKRENGKLLWEVRGKKAELGEIIKVSNPEFNIYTRDNNKIFMRADEGIIYKNTEKIELKGNVFFKDLKRNVKVYLEDLKWLPDKKIFISSGYVKEIINNTIITGKGLIADEELLNIEIKENIVIKKK